MTWRSLAPFFGAYGWIQVIHVANLLVCPLPLPFWSILCRLILLSSDFNRDLGRIHNHFLIFLWGLLRVRFLLWFSDGHILSWKLWRVAERRWHIIKAASICIHDSHAISCVIFPIPLILLIWPRVFAVPIIESLVLLLHSYMLRSRIWKRLHDLGILKLSQLVQLLVTALLSAPSRGLLHASSRTWHCHIFTFLPLLVQKFASRTAQHNMHVFVLTLLISWERWLSSMLSGSDICGSFLLH